MKQMLLLTGAAALFFTGPALAKPGQGHGYGHGQSYPHGIQDAVGYGVGGCPPGLAKKNNGCLPPGQAKKLYRIGQRYPATYGDRLGYGRIPYDLRRQYSLNPQDRYYYSNGYLYQVDPRTMLVQQVIGALLR